MRVLVKPETKDFGLCGTCDHAMMVESGNDQVVMCSYFHPQVRVPRRVDTCSGHTPKNVPSLHDMQEIAWTMRTKNGRPIGFRPPSKRSEEYEE